MTVSDSPVVLEVPTEKISLRSHATSRSLSTWRGREAAGREGTVKNKKENERMGFNQGESRSHYRAGWIHMLQLHMLPVFMFTLRPFSLSGR